MPRHTSPSCSSVQNQQTDFNTYHYWLNLLCVTDQQQQQQPVTTRSCCSVQCYQDFNYVIRGGNIINNNNEINNAVVRVLTVSSRVSAESAPES